MALLLLSPVVAVVSTFQATTVAADCFFNCTTTTIIPGFPLESIGAGLMIGLFVILLLRGFWHIRKPIADVIAGRNHSF